MKLLPFIITKPLICIFGILNLLFYWSSFPGGYKGLISYLWIIWLLIIIYIIGFGLSFCNIKGGKILKYMTYVSLILIHIGYFGYFLALFFLLNMFPNVSIEFDLGIVFAGLILVLVDIEWIYIIIFKKI